MIGQVFEAEKQVAKTGVIHKYCLACNDCHCNLDASSFYNGADGEVVVNFITHNQLWLHKFKENYISVFIAKREDLTAYFEHFFRFHFFGYAIFNQTVQHVLLLTSAV